MSLAFGPGDHILVVGAGPAGTAALAELRRLDFRGRLTVLGDEPPYDRTACSKGILTGAQTPRDVSMPVIALSPVSGRRARTTSGSRGGGVHRKLGRRAVDLDLARRRVGADTGEEFDFDGLVIATGARPAVAPHWPLSEPGIHTLHRVDEAWAARAELRTAQRVVVVGGGVAGCEAAMAAWQLGKDVTIVDPQPTLMYQALGPELGRHVTDSHRRLGWNVRLGRRVAGVTRRRRGRVVALDDSEEFRADLVLLTVGERPDVAWLAGSGLDTRDGIRCDCCLRAKLADGGVATGVVAAGAAVLWPNQAAEGHWRRNGHWLGAIEQGRAAAATLLDGRGDAPPAAVVPRWWSHQGELRIQASGEIDIDAEVRVSQIRPHAVDVARSGVVASHLRDGRLVGVAAINAPFAFTAAARLLLASTHGGQFGANLDDAEIQREVIDLGATTQFRRGQPVGRAHIV